MIRTLIATVCLLIAMTGGAAVQADRVLIQKSARQLTLLRSGRPLRTYRVRLGSNPKGAKEREGDGRTPEGLYTIDSRNAYSKYHSRFMCRIQTPPTVLAHGGFTSARAARS